MYKTRIFLIHGWSGSPQGDWLPWATKELAAKGYEVIAPQMPDTDVPVIRPWVDYLANIVGSIRESDIFIGHSIGCQTVLRYLEKTAGKADKIILVAPWFTLTNLENDEMRHIADPWLKTPMDFSQIKTKAQDFITIFSDNDPWVPYIQNKQMFRDKLNPEIITLHNKGHMTSDEGVTQLPDLLTLL